MRVCVCVCVLLYKQNLFVAASPAMTCNDLGVAHVGVAQINVSIYILEQWDGLYVFFCFIYSRLYASSIYFTCLC